MKHLIQLYLFLTLISFLGCQKENMGDCFKSTGSIVEKTRPISVVSYIELHDRINLYVSIDSVPKLSVKAGENLHEFIRTDIKDNYLIIKNDNRCNWVRSFKKDIDVFLTLPDLRGFEFYGSGEFHLVDTLTTGSFVLNMFQSSGDVFLKLNTPYAELKSHTGPGTITASGKVENLVTFMGGNGFVDAAAIKSKTGLAVATNTGYIRTNTSDFLKADISGSGNIEYFGNPTIELIDNGKGKLIHR